MAEVTWDEIRRLRTDFLNLQLTGTSNKLAERNCVELIGLLVKEGFLSVIYTTDGKEIITEQRLLREILDEIHANQGRINIVDLAQRLKIDLSYIESKVGDICREDPMSQFILGQFITIDYTNRLIEEINDMLTERGLVPMNELIRKYDLPTEYLNSVVTNRIVGAPFSKVKCESGTLYTENYVRLQENILIGCLEAALLPLRVSDIIKHTQVNKNLVQNLIVNLIRNDRIRGNLVGTAKENAIFYPKVHTDAQAKYIESFFAQNKYSVVRNLGVLDPEGQTTLILKDRYDPSTLLFLTSGCVNLSRFVPQLEVNIEQDLVSNDYVDISTLVPNSFISVDIEKLLKAEPSIIEQIKASGGKLISNIFVISKGLQDKIDKQLNTLCEKCVEKELMQCGPQIYAAVLQGNAILVITPSLWEKNWGDNNQETIMFVSQDQFKTQIHRVNEELPDQLVYLLAEDLYRQDLFIRRVKESFSAKEVEIDADTSRKGANDGTKNVEETLKQLHGQICIFSQSILQFQTDNETQLSESLHRHLIGTLCSDMCDILIREVDNLGTEGKAGSLNHEERNKIIHKMSEPSRTELMKLNESLNSMNIDTVLTQIEETVLELFQLLLKRPKKRVKKDLTLGIREKLKAKLIEEQDLPKILHLTTTLLFYAVHGGRLLHVPDSAVPSLIRYLAKSLPTNVNQRLLAVQDYVIQQSTTTIDPTVSDGTIQFLKKLGLSAKENMTFTSFSNDDYH